MAHGGRRRLGRLGVVAWLCLLADLLTPAAQAGSAFGTTRFGLDVAASSDYVVYGITRSHARPIGQAQLAWTTESGWTAGTWISSLGFEGEGPRFEIDPYIGKRWVLARDWSLRMDLSRYLFRPANGWVSYDYTELRSAASYRDMLELAVAYSPDYSVHSSRGLARDQAALVYEASARFPATRWLSLNAGAGHRDLRSAFGTGYWYWSAGAETAFHRLSFALTYIGTSATARYLYGSEYAGDRLVATAALRLR